MSAVIIGSIPWEDLIAKAAEPIPERPPGAFTLAEWMQKTGKSRDVSLRMVGRLVETGVVRTTEGRCIKDGQNRRAVYYVPVGGKGKAR
jgi:hypothetical protein